MPFRIRPAIVQDAASVCGVLRRSIVELCALDHHDDVTLLEPWLKNKTPDNIKRWLADDDSLSFVACQGDRVVGIASMRRSGFLTLNYVLPDVRFTGVSKALLARLEYEALKMGLQKLDLVSSETAQRFYADTGFVKTGSVVSEGASSNTMTKHLATASAKDETHAPRQ